jgi:hypothetical protein
MKRSTLARDIFGTALMFFLLVGVTFLIMLGEKFLDNFKAH